MCSLVIWVGLDLKEAKDLATVIRRSGVADIPEGATAVQTKVVSNHAAWSAFVKFEASAEEIDAFLAASPGTEGGFQARIGVSEPYVPCTEIRDPTWWLQRCWYPVPSAHWWSPTVLIDGRMYELPGSNGYAHGMIIVDDEHGRVWLRMQRP